MNLSITIDSELSMSGYVAALQCCTIPIVRRSTKGNCAFRCHGAIEEHFGQVRRQNRHGRQRI
jgi:hypothetical protein